MRWEDGRQGTGYRKLRLLQSRWPIPFDVYLLHYPVGSGLPLHTDVVEGAEHHRLNITLRHARDGGFPFLVTGKQGCLDINHYPGGAYKFRPDLYEHGMTDVLKGSRWVLSIGWLRKEHSQDKICPMCGV